MFCPRCGRPVSDTANFCGGCGLPRAEIEKYNVNMQQQMVTPAVQPTPEIEPVDVAELNNTISRLEKDLAGDVSVVDYTTESYEDTNTIEEEDTPSDFVQQEMLREQKKTEELKETAVYQQTSHSRQSAYSYNAPQAPEYTAWKNTQAETPYMAPDEQEENQNLSTVDFIWMMLISSLPVAGLFYMIYLGFVQDDNVNKKSFARATLIISIFSFVLAIVFMMGIAISRAMMY